MCIHTSGISMHIIIYVYNMYIYIYIHTHTHTRGVPQARGQAPRSSTRADPLPRRVGRALDDVLNRRCSSDDGVNVVCGPVLKDAVQRVQARFVIRLARDFPQRHEFAEGSTSYAPLCHTLDV